MGGSSAVGFQTSNGQVYYCLCCDYVGIMEAIEMFSKGELNMDTCNETADSITLFLNDERLYENEDSVWRIVKMLDGAIHARRWGVKGVFSYSEHGPL